MDDVVFEVWDNNTFSDKIIASTLSLKLFNIIGPDNGLTKEYPLYLDN